MNEFVEKYCRIKGIAADQIIDRKKRDAKTVILRNAFIYLTWQVRKQDIARGKVRKSTVLEGIGREFGNMKRHTIHEKLEQFEAELSIYRGNKTILDEIKQVIMM